MQTTWDEIWMVNDVGQHAEARFRWITVDHVN